MWEVAIEVDAPEDRSITVNYDNAEWIMDMGIEPGDHPGEWTSRFSVIAVDHPETWCVTAHDQDGSEYGVRLTSYRMHEDDDYTDYDR